MPTREDVLRVMCPECGAPPYNRCAAGGTYVFEPAVGVHSPLGTRLSHHRARWDRYRNGRVRFGQQVHVSHVNGRVA